MQMQTLATFAAGVLVVPAIRLSVNAWLWAFDRCDRCRKPLDSDAVVVREGDRINRRHYRIHEGCRDLPTPEERDARFVAPAFRLAAKAVRCVLSVFVLVIFAVELLLHVAFLTPFVVADELRDESAEGGR